jgi:UDP-N-acetylglucosamine 4,6-dehydratase
MKKNLLNQFKNKKVLITGGTGSFGSTFVKYLLKYTSPKQILIYSRDEMKQWMLKEELKRFNKINYIIGDIRDAEKTHNVFRGIDYVVHAAATKIVPTAERNPEECIKTNVLGGMNVINASIANKVKKVVALSTDKASSPINLYGASKLCSDKLFTSQVNNNVNTTFSVVRYGNVLGSRGSIIPFFLSLKDKSELPITHPEMTRFFLTLEDAVEFVSFAFQNMTGGEIFVKKLNAIKITTLARLINPLARHKIVGIREGEKIHEQMIGVDDSMFTVEFKNHYEILPNFEIKKLKIKKKAKKVKPNFLYSSSTTGKIDSDYLVKKINEIKKSI